MKPKKMPAFCRIKTILRETPFSTEISSASASSGVRAPTATYRKIPVPIPKMYVGSIAPLSRRSSPIKQPRNAVAVDIKLKSVALVDFYKKQKKMIVT